MGKLVRIQPTIAKSSTLYYTHVEVVLASVHAAFRADQIRPLDGREPFLALLGVVRRDAEHFVGRVDGRVRALRHYARLSGLDDGLTFTRHYASARLVGLNARHTTGGERKCCVLTSRGSGLIFAPSSLFTFLASFSALIRIAKKGVAYFHQIIQVWFMIIY